LSPRNKLHISLSAGNISLNYLEQRGIYDGIALGWPSRSYNHGIVENARETYRKRYQHLEVEPYIVMPVEVELGDEYIDPFMKKLQEVKGRTDETVKAVIPPVMTFGEFEALFLTGDDTSMLPIVWFQHDWGIDMPDEVRSEIEALDWHRHAHFYPHPLL